MTICVRGTGEFIADHVSTEDLDRLRGYDDDGKFTRQQMVVPHKKREKLWLAIVPAAAILAELRRSISKHLPAAEDNGTTSREVFSNDKGAGWYYEHRNHICFGYRTTHASLNERTRRQLTGRKA